MVRVAAYYSGLRLIKPPWGGVWVVLLTDWFYYPKSVTLILSGSSAWSEGRLSKALFIQHNSDIRFRQLLDSASWGCAMIQRYDPLLNRRRRPRVRQPRPRSSSIVTQVRNSSASISDFLAHIVPNLLQFSKWGKGLEDARFDTTGSSRAQLPADEDGDSAVLLTDGVVLLSEVR